MASLQAVGRCEIDRRLESLAKLQGVVDASRALTDAHEAALEAILSSTKAGLRALRAEIDGDTTIAALREDIHRIFADFRVYALVARQVWLVKADDTVSATAARFDRAAVRLKAAIDAAEAKGRDVGDARAQLATMIASVGRARAAVGWRRWPRLLRPHAGRLERRHSAARPPRGAGIRARRAASP